MKSGKKAASWRPFSGCGLDPLRRFSTWYTCIVEKERERPLPAMGLALRMAGRDREVVVAQFLKGSDSGERLALAQVPGVRLLEVPEKVKFSFRLTPEEREAERVRNIRLLAQAREAAAAPACGLLVLDEVCAAVNTGLLPLEDVLDCLDVLSCEVVLTAGTGPGTPGPGGLPD